MIYGKKIFITGGGGFIGSNLIRRLADHNEIVVYDSFQRDALSSSDLATHPHLSIIDGNVLDAEHLEQAMRGATHVVHLAAITGIDTVIKDTIHTMRVNIIGTVNVLEAVSKISQCERLVHFSTSEVFGSRAFKSEETDFTIMGAVGEARWTYAVGKLAGEHLAHAYFRQRGVPAVTIRPFNIYGPGQIGEGAIQTFVRRALKGEDLEIHGDGAQIRAWCYIDDMIDALVLCLEAPKAIGESFNIGNQRAVVTTYGLANTVIRICNSRSRILFTRRDYVDIELRIPSVEKARRILGFEAKVDLEEGIARTAEYYKNFLR